MYKTATIFHELTCYMTKLYFVLIRRLKTTISRNVARLPLEVGE